MLTTAMRILVVGELLPVTREILCRFSERGWGYQNVSSVRDARVLLDTFEFDVVLASESLCDGRGYDVADLVARHSGTLLVGVALSETRLWLPVVIRGVGVLGKRALNIAALESEMETLLGATLGANGSDDSREHTRDEIREGVRETLREMALENERGAARDAVRKNVRQISPKPSSLNGRPPGPQPSTMTRRKYRDRHNLPM